MVVVKTTMGQHRQQKSTITAPLSIRFLEDFEVNSADSSTDRVTVYFASPGLKSLGRSGFHNLVADSVCGLGRPWTVSEFQQVRKIRQHLTAPGELGKVIVRCERVQ